MPLARVRPRRALVRGFTLIELMVTVTVVGILTMIAAPSFSTAIINNRLSNYANNFIAAVQLARSEATKRNATVQICRRARATDSATTPSCASSGSWQAGWFVWVDTSGDGNLQASEILREQEALSTDFTFCTLASGVCSSASSAYSLQFKPTGVDTTANDFVVCREAGKAKRKITLLGTARTAVTSYLPPAAETNTCP